VHINTGNAQEGSAPAGLDLRKLYVARLKSRPLVGELFSSVRSADIAELECKLSLVLMARNSQYGTRWSRSLLQGWNMSTGIKSSQNGSDIYDVSGVSSSEHINDLDWTSTPDNQSILAIGFVHRVELLSQQCKTYFDDDPNWAVVWKIEIGRWFFFLLLCGSVRLDVLYHKASFRNLSATLYGSQTALFLLALGIRCSSTASP
jgi:hypothetical protein